MNKIYFAQYNVFTCSVQITIGSKITIIFNCNDYNQQVLLYDPLYIAYLTRISIEEPFNYASYASRPNGLQDYIDTINKFN